MSVPLPFQSAVDKVSKALEADVYLFSSLILSRSADMLIRVITGNKIKRKDAVLILITNGGSADSAYQIARCLKRHYGKLTLFAFGDCKSAGTLIAIAADEIVMSDLGQFGPLDVQLADKQDLFSQMAALEVTQTLDTLSNSSHQFFIEAFQRLSEEGFPSKMGMEVALSITNAIIEPMASHIDPLLLGRVERSMRIAEAYSKRLDKTFQNIKKLTGDYPSHEFVIDFEEAKEIFKNVRQAKDEECELQEALLDCRISPHATGCVMMISLPLPKTTPDSTTCPSVPNDTQSQQSSAQPIPTAPNGNSEQPDTKAELVGGTSAAADGEEAAGAARRREPASRQKAV